MNKLKKDSNYTNQTFEDIKHIDENGIEYWYARELMKILGYKQWRKFDNVIDKTKQACENNDISTFEHFANVSKLSRRANNAEVEIKDYKLTRYACYLIAQNGDTRKKVIALAQTYFAIQTRKQEITEKENKNSLEKVEMNMIKQGNNIVELWEVLDDKGNATGEIMQKYDQKIFDRGFYHLGADVWIINSDNKILI